ncbi:involucrin repeat protein [Moelleriella libera RCEF 2490]|uniref:Involucrin repeat protein n=1 Tax=Moelleriella libera RCEF 2490 TaxID=1081109 RepID=A0A168BZI7_9HYPO|nr:involucrin repeat protein [Moelleriella libera RCEF 2490]
MRDARQRSPDNSRRRRRDQRRQSRDNLVYMPPQSMNEANNSISQTSATPNYHSSYPDPTTLASPRPGDVGTPDHSQNQIPRGQGRDHSRNEDWQRFQERRRQSRHRTAPSDSTTSLSSSSTASSLLDISRHYPIGNRFGGILGTFWRAPSERRVRRRRSGRAKRRRMLIFSNSSSSSVNSDLAYGNGYIPCSKHRGTAMNRTVAEAYTPEPLRGEEGRSAKVNDRSHSTTTFNRHTGHRKDKTDEEILALGRQLSDFARSQNEHDRRSSGKAKIGGLAAAAAATHQVRTKRRDAKTHDHDNPRTHGRHPDSSDESDWEDASDDEAGGLSEAESALAYGSSMPQALRPAEERSKAVRSGLPSRPFEGLTMRSARKSSIVDPSLFGPQNSLRGMINTPCGFGPGQSAAEYQQFNRLRRSETEPIPKDAPMHDGHVGLASESDRFDAKAASGTLPSLDLPYRSRPAPIPLQQPSPKVPVSSKIFQAEKLEDGREHDGAKLAHTRSEETGLGRGAKLAGLAAAAAAAAALASDRKSKRDTRREERREERREPVRDLTGSTREPGRQNRNGRPTTDFGENRKKDRDVAYLETGQSSKRHEKDGEPDVTRSSKRDFDTAKPPDDRRHKRHSRHDEDEIPRKRREKEVDHYPEDELLSRRHRQSDDGRIQKSEVSSSSRRESRKIENLNDRHREEPTNDKAIKPTISSVAKAGVDPFQFQIAGDASATTLGISPAPPRPLTPTVVTIDREPSFDDDNDFSAIETSESRLSRKDSFEIERMVEDYKKGAQRSSQYAESQSHSRGEKQPDTAGDLEGKCSTVPGAAIAAVSAAAAAAAAAAEAGRSKERPRDKEPSRDSSRPAIDPVQEEANRYYRESFDAQKLAKEEQQGQDDNDFRNPSYTIVTPPAMEDSKPEESRYAGPDADVKIDNRIYPRELDKFRTEDRFANVFTSRDPSCERERPLLNLVYPTPVPTPSMSRSSSEIGPRSSTRDVSKDRARGSDDAARAQDDHDTRDDYRIGPLNDAIDVMPSITSAATKSVTWGENSTKSFNAESPEPKKNTEAEWITSKTGERPRPRLDQNSRWGIVASAIADTSQEPATESELENSVLNRRSSSDVGTDRRGSALPEYDSFKEETRSEPPVPGPKPASPATDRMPGGFADDLEFAATLAAGLKDTGFDPNIVIDDPAYRRRDSPPNSSESNGDGWNRASLSDAVSNLTSKQKDVSEPGFLSGPIDADTASPSASADAGTEFSVAPSKKETKELDNEAGQGSFDPAKPFANVLSETPSPAATADKPLSRKEQKKLEKAQRRAMQAGQSWSTQSSTTRGVDNDPDVSRASKQRGFDQEFIVKEKPDGESRDDERRQQDDHSTSRAVDGAGWEDSTGKKSRKGRQSRDVDVDPASKVSARTDSFDNKSAVGGTGLEDEWDTPKRSKSKSVEKGSHGSDVVSVSAPGSEVGDSVASSRRSSKSARRRDLDFDTSTAESPVRNRDLWDDREVSSVVSESRADERRRERRSKRSSAFDDDDDRSIASAPGSARKSKRASKYEGDEFTQRGKEKELERAEKRSSGGLFATLFKGSKDDSKKLDKESFLDDAGILGAGAGLATAAAIMANDSRSNATHASTALLKEAPEAFESSEKTQTPTSIEDTDPEIAPRAFKPAIDPQYGDLLPMPPSEPGSPVSDTVDLPALPDSRPSTPPEARSLKHDLLTHQRRRSTQETPAKSPSLTAIPISLRLGQRHGAPSSSPNSRRSPPSSSPATTPESGRRSSRFSWDSSREIKPLYLLERQGPVDSIAQAHLPALPPSEPSEPPSRESPAPGFMDMQAYSIVPDKDISLDETPDPKLRVDTDLAASSLAEDVTGSQQTTPKALIRPQILSGLSEEHPVEIQVAPVREAVLASSYPSAEQRGCDTFELAHLSVDDKHHVETTASRASLSVPDAPLSTLTAEGSMSGVAEDLTSADEHFSDALEGPQSDTFDEARDSFERAFPEHSISTSVAPEDPKQSQATSPAEEPESEGWRNLSAQEKMKVHNDRRGQDVSPLELAGVATASAAAAILTNDPDPDKTDDSREFTHEKESQIPQKGKKGKKNKKKASVIDEPADVSNNQPMVDNSLDKSGHAAVALQATPGTTTSAKDEAGDDDNVHSPVTQMHSDEIDKMESTVGTPVAEAQVVTEESGPSSASNLSQDSPFDTAVRHQQDNDISKALSKKDKKKRKKQKSRENSSPNSKEDPTAAAGQQVSTDTLIGLDQDTGRGSFLVSPPQAAVVTALSPVREVQELDVHAVEPAASADTRAGPEQLPAESVTLTLIQSTETPAIPPVDISEKVPEADEKVVQRCGDAASANIAPDEVSLAHFIPANTEPTSFPSIHEDDDASKSVQETKIEGEDKKSVLSDGHSLAHAEPEEDPANGSSAEGLPTSPRMSLGTTPTALVNDPEPAQNFDEIPPVTSAGTRAIADAQSHSLITEEPLTIGKATFVDDWAPQTSWSHEIVVGSPQGATQKEEDLAEESTLSMSVPRTSLMSEDQPNPDSPEIVPSTDEEPSVTEAATIEKACDPGRSTSATAFVSAGKNKKKKGKRKSVQWEDSRLHLSPESQEADSPLAGGGLGDSDKMENQQPQEQPEEKLQESPQEQPSTVDSGNSEPVTLRDVSQGLKPDESITSELLQEEKKHIDETRIGTPAEDSENESQSIQASVLDIAQHKMAEENPDASHLALSPPKQSQILLEQPDQNNENLLLPVDRPAEVIIEAPPDAKGEDEWSAPSTGKKSKKKKGSKSTSTLEQSSSPKVSNTADETISAEKSSPHEGPFPFAQEPKSSQEPPPFAVASENPQSEQVLHDDEPQVTDKKSKKKKKRQSLSTQPPREDTPSESLPTHDTGTIKDARAAANKLAEAEWPQATDEEGKKRQQGVAIDAIQDESSTSAALAGDPVFLRPEAAVTISAADPEEEFELPKKGKKNKKKKRTNIEAPEESEIPPSSETNIHHTEKPPSDNNVARDARQSRLTLEQDNTGSQPAIPGPAEGSPTIQERDVIADEAVESRDVETEQICDAPKGTVTADTALNDAEHSENPIPLSPTMLSKIAQKKGDKGTADTEVAALEEGLKSRPVERSGVAGMPGVAASAEPAEKTEDTTELQRIIQQADIQAEGDSTSSPAAAQDLPLVAENSDQTTAVKEVSGLKGALRTEQDSPDADGEHSTTETPRKGGLEEEADEPSMKYQHEQTDSNNAMAHIAMTSPHDIETHRILSFDASEHTKEDPCEGAAGRNEAIEGNMAKMSQHHEKESLEKGTEMLEIRDVANAESTRENTVSEVIGLEKTGTGKDDTWTGTMSKKDRKKNKKNRKAKQGSQYDAVPEPPSSENAAALTDAKARPEDKEANLLELATEAQIIDSNADLSDAVQRDVSVECSTQSSTQNHEKPDEHSRNLIAPLEASTDQTSVPEDVGLVAPATPEDEIFKPELPFQLSSDLSASKIEAVDEEWSAQGSSKKKAKRDKRKKKDQGQSLSSGKAIPSTDTIVESAIEDEGPISVVETDNPGQGTQRESGLDSAALDLPGISRPNFKLTEAMDNSIRSSAALEETKVSEAQRPRNSLKVEATEVVAEDGQQNVTQDLPRDLEDMKALDVVASETAQGSANDAGLESCDERSPIDPQETTEAVEQVWYEDTGKTEDTRAQEPILSGADTSDRGKTAAPAATWGDFIEQASFSQDGTSGSGLWLPAQWRVDESTLSESAHAAPTTAAVGATLGGSEDSQPLPKESLTEQSITKDLAQPALIERAPSPEPCPPERGPRVTNVEQNQSVATGQSPPSGHRSIQKPVGQEAEPSTALGHFYPNPPELASELGEVDEGDHQPPARERVSSYEDTVAQYQHGEERARLEAIDSFRLSEGMSNEEPRSVERDRPMALESSPLSHEESSGRQHMSEEVHRQADIDQSLLFETGPSKEHTSQEPDQSTAVKQSSLPAQSSSSESVDEGQNPTTAMEQSCLLKRLPSQETANEMQGCCLNAANLPGVESPDSRPTEENNGVGFVEIPKSCEQRIGTLHTNELPNESVVASSPQVLEDRSIEESSGMDRDRSVVTETPTFSAEEKKQLQTTENAGEMAATQDSFSVLASSSPADDTTQEAPTVPSSDGREHVATKASGTIDELAPLPYGNAEERERGGGELPMAEDVEASTTVDQPLPEDPREAPTAQPEPHLALTPDQSVQETSAAAAADIWAVPSKKKGKKGKKSKSSSGAITPVEASLARQAEAAVGIATPEQSTSALPAIEETQFSGTVGSTPKSAVAVDADDEWAVPSKKNKKGKKGKKGNSAEGVSAPADKPASEQIVGLVIAPADVGVMEPVNEPIDETVTESVTEAVTEQVTEPITEPVTEPVTEQVDEPVHKPLDQPVNTKASDPVSEGDVSLTEAKALGASEQNKNDLNDFQVYTDERMSVDLEKQATSGPDGIPTMIPLIDDSNAKQESTAKRKKKSKKGKNNGGLSNPATSPKEPSEVPIAEGVTARVEPATETVRAAESETGSQPANEERNFALATEVRGGESGGFGSQPLLLSDEPPMNVAGPELDKSRAGHSFDLNVDKPIEDIHGGVNHASMSDIKVSSTLSGLPSPVSETPRAGDFTVAADNASGPRPDKGKNPAVGATMADFEEVEGTHASAKDRGTGNLDMPVMSAREAANEGYQEPPLSEIYAPDTAIGEHGSADLAKSISVVSKKKGLVTPTEKVFDDQNVTADSSVQSESDKKTHFMGAAGREDEAGPYQQEIIPSQDQPDDAGDGQSHETLTKARSMAAAGAELGGVALLAEKFGGSKKKKGKGKLKKVVDKRQAQEEDIFDDPALWEGADKKGLDEGRDAALHDDFWGETKSDEKSEEQKVDEDKGNTDYRPDLVSAPMDNMEMRSEETERRGMPPRDEADESPVLGHGEAVDFVPRHFAGLQEVETGLSMDRPDILPAFHSPGSDPDVRPSPTRGLPPVPEVPEIETETVARKHEWHSPEVNRDSAPQLLMAAGRAAKGQRCSRGPPGMDDADPASTRGAASDTRAREEEPASARQHSGGSGTGAEPPATAPRRSASNTSLSRRRTPEPLRLAGPESPGIHEAQFSSSPLSQPPALPPLRRVDKRMSGDLRALRQQSSSSTPVANEGRLRSARSSGDDSDMADVYDGYGEGRIGSPRSPTRPHSMRRRQSMQVLELEARVDQLVAENRLLSEARRHAEQNFSVLSERDAEIESLKQSLQFLQNEVARLAEVNEGLSGANAELASKDSGRFADMTRELDAARGTHSTFTQTVRDKDAEIEHLRAQLEDAKARIRQMQREILDAKAGSDSDFLNLKDEDYFDHRCQQLCAHVQQWVLRFSKFSDMRACRLTSEISDEKTIDRLDNTILDGSDVDVYLRDRVRRRDIFMSMTMSMVWEFIFTRYLFGMDREQRQKLKSLEKLLTEVGPVQAVRQWRAVTLTLLSRRPAFADQRDLDTEAVVQAIFQTLCKILPPPSNMESQIQSQLRRVMHEAVQLSIEMRTQRAEYMMLPPLQPEYDADGELSSTVAFDAAMMNERGGSGRTGTSPSNEELEAQNAVVRLVLFPLVVKRGDDNGVGEDKIVVCPAQVLVAGGDDNRRHVTPSSEAGGASLNAPSRISVVTESMGLGRQEDEGEAHYIEGGI